MNGTQGALVICGGCLVCLLLGSVHAFSVFLAPLETGFSASRASVSLTYSLALVALTVAVLCSHRIFTRVSATFLIAGTCLVAALGALIAAWSGSLTGVWIGYSLLFGGANGLGYAFSLQSAAMANPGREGMAMGIITAAYALGATVSPTLFSMAMDRGGFSGGHDGSRDGPDHRRAPLCHPDQALADHLSEPESGAAARVAPRALALLWGCYGAGVAAGLMAIGHAAGIASAAGWQGASWITPALIALLNMGGSFAGGWLTDRIAPLRMLIALPLFSAGALLAIVGSGDSTVTLIGLSCVGFAYGAIIAVFPATLAKLFGMAEGARVYGTVFTAWGAAGLFAPWLAGALYDRTGGYGGALSVAVALGIASALMAMRLSSRPPGGA